VINTVCTGRTPWSFQLVSFALTILLKIMLRAAASTTAMTSQQAKLPHHQALQDLLFPLFWQGGVEKLGQLRVLYLSNNKIRDWTEVDRLAAAEKLEDLLLVGNPLYNDYRDTNAIAEYRVEVCRQL